MNSFSRGLFRQESKTITQTRSVLSKTLTTLSRGTSQNSFTLRGVPIGVGRLVIQVIESLEHAGMINICEDGRFEPESLQRSADIFCIILRIWEFRRVSVGTVADDECQTFVGVNTLLRSAQ